MAIDLNTIKCGCAFRVCLIGIRFDSDPDIIMIQDKQGMDTAMFLNKENTNQLLDELKAIKKRNKW